MEIKCSPGYEIEKPNEKYKCDKVKIKGKKARVVKPEPKCVRKSNLKNLTCQRHMVPIETIEIFLSLFSNPRRHRNLT